MKESGSSQGGDGDLHPTGSPRVGFGRGSRSDCLLASSGFGAPGRSVGRAADSHAGRCSSEPWTCSASSACRQRNNRPSTFWLPLLPPAHMWHKNFRLFFLQCTEWLSAVNQIEFGERVSHQPEASGVRAGNLRISI